jgi:uncharacterized protein YciI
MRRRDVFALALGALAFASAAAAQQDPVHYFVLMHTPGPAWNRSKGFKDQPGIEKHVAYMQGFSAQGKILLGGPFLDDSGGMMIADVPTLEEARAIADGDPTVKSGLLVVTIKPWLAVLHP